MARVLRNRQLTQPFFVAQATAVPTPQSVIETTCSLSMVILPTIVAAKSRSCMLWWVTRDRLRMFVTIVPWVSDVAGGPGAWHAVAPASSRTWGTPGCMVRRVAWGSLPMFVSVMVGP